MMEMAFNPAALVVQIPVLAAAVLALTPSYRIGAALNVLASFLTFVAAMTFFIVRPEPMLYFLVDDLNIVFIVLTTFIGFTASTSFLSLGFSNQNILSR